MKKQLTKKEELILNAYLRARENNQRTLWLCYEYPSREKERIVDEIKHEMVSCGGYSFYIVSYNKFMFTCAYRVNNDLVYHTPTQKIIIKGAF